jgi:hypothetical protein
MIQSNFINEIGNKIKIKIKNKKDSGVNYKTKEKIFFDEVSITITGPTSLTENVITYMEAEELFFYIKKVS